VLSWSRIACSARAMPAANPLAPLPTRVGVLTNRKRSFTIIATMRTKAYLFAAFRQEHAPNYFCTVSGKPLAMTPVGFDTIEPGAFRRQLANDDSHATFLFCLSVVSPNPIAHFMAKMPRGMVPDQQQRLLSPSCCNFSRTHPRKPVVLSK